VNRNAAAGQDNEECLSVPNSSTANGVQLVQTLCDGGSNQSFDLVPAS
jgi:hypothetical protein